ncbi:MAG TPA: SCO family protein [Vicinamibacterales bacterium]|nr:SCO family protein [Vicinamibacterales bacterium]
MHVGYPSRLGGFLVVGVLLSGGACARHYTTKGLVLRVDQPGAIVTISHDAFPGFMDAMAMPFDLKGAARRATLTAGDRVRLRLSVRGGRSWIDRLDVISAAPLDAGLEQTPVTHVLVPVGSRLPDFSLTDQAGQPVSLSGLTGRVVAVTFIYSRCPLPDYCPRMVENFRAVRARFADRMDRDLVLLTISFDPQYDTPQVLAQYAASMRAGGPGWHFLTGDPVKIERVCNAFGIQYFPDEGLITHSLQTAVIDRDGRLAATVEGKDFTPRQLGDLIGSVLERRR